jgi:hypothetical protein
MMGQSRPDLNISSNDGIATVMDWHGATNETARASDQKDRAEAVSASDTNGRANINFLWLCQEQNKLKKESRHWHVSLPEICSIRVKVTAATNYDFITKQRAHEYGK